MISFRLINKNVFSLTWTSVVLYHMTVSIPVATCILPIKILQHWFNRLQVSSLIPQKGRDNFGVGAGNSFFCCTHYQSSTLTSLQEKISCKLSRSPKWITKRFHVAHFFLSLLQEMFTLSVLTAVIKGNHDHAYIQHSYLTCNSLGITNVCYNK